jgi:hypothetical protein
LFPAGNDCVAPDPTLPTTPAGAPIAGESSLLPTCSSVDVSAHATAASENTARAAISNHVVGFENLILLMTISFDLLTIDEEVGHRTLYLDELFLRLIVV